MLTFNEKNGIILNIKIGSLHGNSDISGIIKCVIDLFENAKIPEIKLSQKCICIEFAYFEKYFFYFYSKIDI